MHPYQSPWMDEDLAIFRESASRFVESEMLPGEAQWRTQQHVSRELWRKAGELGFLCTDIPAQYGGGGGDFRHEAVLYEEQARRGFTGFGQAVHSICAHYLLNHGTDAQKREYLPRMANGSLIGAIAMTEPGAGSDLQAIQTRAKAVDDHFVVNGSKTFITNGYLAGLVIVVARTEAAEGAKGISLLLVEPEASEGFSLGRNLKKLGQHAQDTCELFFDDMKVPAANVLGGVRGNGFYQLMQDLPYERLILGVVGVAAMEGALAQTVDYVKSRKAFGKTLLEHQNTRFRLAEVKTITHIARVFVDNCIERVIAGTLDTETASMAKWWIADMQQKVMDECLQLHGGYGYMDEYLICRMFADARVQRIYGGTNEIMKELIARSL